jgi:hypothetical protein
MPHSTGAIPASPSSCSQNLPFWFFGNNTHSHPEKPFLQLPHPMVGISSCLRQAKLGERRQDEVSQFIENLYRNLAVQACPVRVDHPPEASVAWG